MIGLVEAEFSTSTDALVAFVDGDILRESPRREVQRSPHRQRVCRMCRPVART
ncbi:hypothetical protein ABLN97_00985 [Mycobacterium tuberculosis]